MKRLFCVLFILILLPIVSFSEQFDPSGLSYFELMGLLGRVERALWACDEWTSVEVPSGVYKIGEEIPACHWSIQAYDGTFMIIYGTELESHGASIKHDSIIWSGFISNEPQFPNMLHQLDIILEDGNYLELQGKAVFYPFTGKLKPDFNFD